MSYGEKENFIGQWSIDKLLFLERYLPFFIKATQKALHRYYIDGFAGRGEWIHKNTGEIVPGSAVIALKHAEFFTHLFFIEFDSVRASYLKNLVKEMNLDSKVTILVGDCNKEIKEITRKIHLRAPTFVFLDPSGDQLYWNTIEHLSTWKTELFILYPYNMTIARYLPLNGNQEDWVNPRLDSLFGTNEWLEIYKANRRLYLESKLLKLYTDRLRLLGFTHCNVSDCFKSDTGQKLYYMIWVGKHPIGKKIMDWVFNKQNNQIAFF